MMQKEMCKRDVPDFMALLKRDVNRCVEISILRSCAWQIMLVIGMS